MKRGHELAPGIGLALLLASLGSGCVMTRRAGQTRPATPLSPELANYYRSQPITGPATVRSVRERSQYTVREVELPTSVIPQRPIRLVWFAPRGSGARPLILISPIKGSDTLFTAGFAELFALRGYHAVIVKRPPLHVDPAGPLRQVEDLLHAAVIRNRQALDWLLTQPGVDAQRVGSLGISYGAIINAALAGVEPRVRASVFDLAGGPLAEVLRTSEERSLRHNWRRTHRAHGLTSGQLCHEFRDIIQTDPLRLAPHVDPNRVMMVVALFDHSVASANQLDLWRALGKPRAMFVPLGHYTSILAMPFHRMAVVNFFEDQFGTETKPPLQADAATGTSASPHL